MKKMVKSYKKAISPVVATALLLVVAVLAVVSFQTWFTSYQSGLNAQVENQSDNNRLLVVDGLEGTTDAEIYLRNSNSLDRTVNRVRIVSSGTTVCENATTFTAVQNDITITSVTGCSLTTGVAYDVVVVTPEGLTRETEIAR